MKMSTAPSANGVPAPLLLLRSAVGGLLMGLANLVPGISGGTMLLAAGIYTAFVDAIAEVTTLRFRRRSLLVLGVVGGAAALAILGFAGPVKTLVVDHRWIMYSLFIGLTLGGVPVVSGVLGRRTRAAWVGAAVGFLAMAALALLQQSGAAAAAAGEGGRFAALLVAGLAGACAMILPGVSGGYLLLVLGQYIPILRGIDDFKDALRAADFGAAAGVGLSVLLPVGLGVLLGIVAVSNLLRFLLRRYEKATLGVLLGLLLGAVVGLWPYQQGVRPAAGERFQGRVLTEEMLAELDPDSYPTQRFTPGAGQVGAGLGLILAGFLCTLGVSRIGGGSPAAGGAEDRVPASRVHRRNRRR